MRKGAGGWLWIAAALAASAASAAHADPVFDDEKKFLAAVGATSLESFEELDATGESQQSEIETPAFRVRVRRRDIGIFRDPVVGLHATHGSHHLVWDADPGEITFIFEAPIRAFGVTLNDALDQGSGPRLSLSTNGGLELPDLRTGPLPDANELFIGIRADTPFTRVVLKNNTRDSLGFDGVHYVPAEEPAAP